MTVTSKLPVERAAGAEHDVLLIGAAGNTGRQIASELVARGLTVLLAGRHLGALDDLRRSLSKRGATTQTRIVDVADAGSLAGPISSAGVVLSTVGPFTRFAAPVVDACLAASVPYVDVANEWPAVKALLDRDREARERGISLVTGAGFGPAATEALVLRLVGQMHEVPIRVRVAAAAVVESAGKAVAQTVQETMSYGALSYQSGQLVHESLGTGAAWLTFGDVRRRMFPAPVGDLEAARRASRAGNVVAYVQDPTTAPAGQDSFAWAEVTAGDGRQVVAELQVGDGVQAAAVIAAETTVRVLAGASAGAWTPGQLFGPSLVTNATGARVTIDGRAA